MLFFFSTLLRSFTSSENLYPRVVDSGNNFHPVGIKQTERSESHRRFLCARLLRALTMCTDPCHDYARRCAETFHRSFLLLLLFTSFSRIFSLLTRFLLDYFSGVVLILFLPPSFRFSFFFFSCNEIIAGGRDNGMLKIQRTSLFKGAGMEMTRANFCYPSFETPLSNAFFQEFF